MAIEQSEDAIRTVEDWYTDYAEDPRDGSLSYRDISEAAFELYQQYTYYKSEMDARTSGYEKLEMLADAEVISPKEDLPNVSSGEVAGIVRRMARNLVQHTPNVEVVSQHDDSSPAGVFSKFILTSKIIGSDKYSSDMQQNLFASTKTAITLGFDCVIPVLLQDAANGWYVHYDSIHYRDVFPEPGTKDIRQATDVFVRRYLTPGEVKQLIRNQPDGWDVPALKRLLKEKPSNKEHNDHQSQKHHTLPRGYEIVTWYSNSGRPFLTFYGREKTLLRIEKNNHPLKWHPVHFLVLEKDSQQPLGKSQVELILGRQEFQDLMLNGAMKMWYRNINPSIIGYGTVNAIPNLSPGKFTQISNPNAKVEALEINTQTLMSFGQISQQNSGNMVQMVGAADQQMATENTGGQMSATPQGVEQQKQMVDITANNFQKAIESFFSHYCSYALTMFFNELKGVEEVTPTADARQGMIAAGINTEAFDEDGVFKIKFSDLATEYFVRTIPGSLVEMEDEKQMRLLQQIFVPLAQAMQPMSASGDQALIANAAYTLQFIMQKTIELSGAADAKKIVEIYSQGVTPQLENVEKSRIDLENTVSGMGQSMLDAMEAMAKRMEAMESREADRNQVMGTLLDKLGVQSQPSADTAQISQQ